MANSLWNSESIVYLRFAKLSFLPSGMFSREILRASGMDVRTVEYDYKGAADTDKADQIHWSFPWIRYFPQKLHFSLLLIMTVLRFLWAMGRFGRPKLLVAQGLSEQTICYYLYRLFKMPYVVHHHELFEKQDLTHFRKLLLNCEKNALENASFVIVPHKGRAAVIRKRYQLKTPLLVAYNCPQKRWRHLEKKFHLDQKIPLDAPVMAYVGGIGHRNGLEQGIEAIANFPELYFLVMGRGERAYVNRLMQMGRRMGISDRLVFLSDVSEDVKWQYLDSATMAYCYYEPQEIRLKLVATASNKLWEAVAAGLPVITNNTEDFRKIVETFQIGECIDLRMEGALSEAITKLLYDPDRLAEIKERCLQLHHSQFNYRHQFRKVLTTYHVLMENLQVPKKSQQFS